MQEIHLLSSSNTAVFSVYRKLKFWKHCASVLRDATHDTVEAWQLDHFTFCKDLQS
jgi:hypothetical protein